MMTTSVSPPAYAQTKLFLMAIGVLAGGTLAQIAPQSCTFESGTCGWTESGANAWTRGTSTPSADTGAKKAQQGKYFMYLETSNGSPGDASYLVSTGLSVAQQQSSRSMVFYYHMYGTSMGILSVETQVHGRWSTLWSKRGQQHRVDGASWTKARAVLPKGTTRVRFKGTKGHSYTGDMCIDTVLLREPSRSCVVSARDNPSFRDKAGDVCIGWVGYNCFNSADYSVAALKNIRQNCPRSCSTCSCARPDSSSFRDSQGDGCADWVGYSCVEQPKYSDSELRQVRQHCPKACGFCGQQQPHKLINSGNSGCTAKQKCALCHGDCDSDVECQAGLHCFQRNGQSQIPGCTMIAKANIAGYDFCYSQTSPPAPPPPASSGTAQHQGNSFDINQLNLIKSLGNAHTKGTLAYARSLDFSPDHKILASCSQNEIKIWSVAGLKDMKLLTTLTKTSDFEEVVFIDDHLMASASSDSSGGISLWRMNGGNTAHWIDVVGQGQQVSLSGGFFESAAYDSTLRVLALGDIGGKIELWAMPDHVSRFDYRRLKLASRLPYAHSNSHWPTSLAFSPNHQILASASKGEIKVWTVKSSGLGSLVTTLSRNDEFTDVAFISSSIMISVSDGGGSSSNGGVSLWKINRGRLQYWKDIKGSGQLRSFTTGFFESVAYDPTSNLLAIGDIGGKIEMWSGARAVTKYVGWQKEAFVFCRSSDTIASQYTTRRQAENACKENPRCLAISDTSCDDRGRWVTCKSAKGAKSAMNSCMYIKGHVSTGRVEYNVASTNAKCDSKLTEISECIAAAKALGIKAKLNQEATTVCAKNVPDPSCSTKPHGCIYQAQVGILQFNKAPSLVPCGASSQACICSSARHWQINKNHYCSTKDTIRSGYKTEAAAQSACNTNPDCKSISDYNCDGKGTWVICRDVVGTSSSLGSCTYAKPLAKLWTRVTNRYCNTKQLSQHSSRALAEKACAANARCKSIYDASCDAHGTWYTCDSAKGSPSEQHSCLYVKPVAGNSGVQAMPGSFVIHAPKDSVEHDSDGLSFKILPSKSCFHQPVYQGPRDFLYRLTSDTGTKYWVIASKKSADKCGDTIYAYTTCSVLGSRCAWKESHKGQQGWISTKLQLVATNGGGH